MALLYQVFYWLHYVAGPRLSALLIEGLYGQKGRNFGLKGTVRPSIAAPSHLVATAVRNAIFGARGDERKAFRVENQEK